MGRAVIVLARGLLLALVVALGASACATHVHGPAEALEAWRTGGRDRATVLAREEYDRFRRGSGLADDHVQRTVRDAMAALAERPVVPHVGLPLPVSTADLGPGALRGAIRTDLLSRRATAVLRACASVANLGLTGHGPDLIAVIYDREPVAADGGLLEAAGVGLRSVATKRAALDALERLAAGR